VFIYLFLSCCSSKPFGNEFADDLAGFPFGQHGREIQYGPVIQLIAQELEHPGLVVLVYALDVLELLVSRRRIGVFDRDWPVDRRLNRNSGLWLSDFLGSLTGVFCFPVVIP
jgi:hypothetical protein